LADANAIAIKLYGSAGMYMSPEGYAREAEIIAKNGFHTLTKCGPRSAGPGFENGGTHAQDGRPKCRPDD